MVNSCIVQNCPSKGKEKSKQPQRKSLSMFKPRNAEMLEKWKLAVGRTYREMTLKDVVCELHFDEHNIVRYFEHKLVDGSTFRLEKVRPSLLPDAVPRAVPLMKSENLENIPSPVFRNLEKEKDNGYLITAEIALEQVTFNYKTILTSINEIKVPSKSWVISNISEFSNNYIVITKWINFQPERWVVIDDNLNTQVFFKEKKMNISCKIHSVDDITDFLNTVNCYDLCSGINDKDVKNCQQLLEINAHGRKRKYCKECSIRRRRKYDVDRKALARKASMSPKNSINSTRNSINTTLYCKLWNTKLKNSLLQNEIVQLRKELMSLRKKNSSVFAVGNNKKSATQHETVHAL